MRYAKYKPTGIAWLPEVPEEWECVSLGRVLEEPLSYGASEAGEIEEAADRIRYIRITDITLDGKLKSDGRKFLEREKAKGLFLQKGDVLFARSGATVGKSYIFEEDFEACYAGYLIRASVKRDKVIPNYLAYFSQSSNYEEWKNRIFIQATIQNISAAKYARLQLTIPPLPTQRAIVAFLDEKCGKVDRLVAAKEKEVALLKELKQSMIAEAVTRGVCKNRRLVASGIPWLPEVPEGWEVLRNKTFLKLTDEKVGDRKSEFVLLSLTKQGVIIRDLTEMKGKFPKDFDTYLVVRPNNLVFCLFDVDETPRTVGLVRNVGMLTGAYTNFEVDATKVLPEFAYYFYLQVDDAKKLRPYYTGLRKVVKTNTFLQLRMPVPPLAEQREIVAHIEAKAAKIDAAVSGLEREIAALKEYKQRLIADVVTGQRKVA